VIDFVMTSHSASIMHWAVCVVRCDAKCYSLLIATARSALMPL